MVDEALVRMGRSKKMDNPNMGENGIKRNDALMDEEEALGHC